MEMYLQLLQTEIDNVSNLIYNIEEVTPESEQLGGYKMRCQEQLTTARLYLREAMDQLEWYVRKS